jgi:hypothetical protein
MMDIGDRPALLLAWEIVNCNVFIGPGLIAGGKSLISDCGSLGSVQVRSRGIHAGQSMLWVLCFLNTSVCSCQT